MKILIVDDEDDFRKSCAKYLSRKGHEVQGASSGADALSLLETEPFEVAIFDKDMPGMTGLELMQRVQEANLNLEVVFLTGQGTIETAVSAMKMGACDYLTKPCSLGDLEHHCMLARERGKLRKENRQLKAVISRSKPKAKLVGDSRSMQDVKRMIARIAPTAKPVLIEGESGTGKEIVARSIQELSDLASQPFVTINCAALPEQLVESELFGHQKGSFTGATAEKPGLFEIADGGTLFIDEIGELPLSLQPKLLRVLEDGSLRRIGCHRERRVQVRIIAATNRNLAQEVKEGRFREDLYYRINVLSLHLPALREHSEDIEQLIEYLLPNHWTIEPDALQVLLQYSWPGNVRQLNNVIERATILADNHEITLDDLPAEMTDHSLRSANESDASIAMDPSLDSDPNRTRPPRPRLGSTDVKLEELTRAHVLEVLASENGNKASAARKLGIHRRKLYRLLERYQSSEPVDIS